MSPALASPEFSVATSTSASDAELIERTLDGEMAAFEALHTRYRERIERFAASRLHDSEEARDVAQEVFIEMYRGLSKYRGDSSLWTWLCGIAYHRVCARFRTRRDTRPLLEVAADTRIMGSTPRTEERVDARIALERCAEIVENTMTPSVGRILHLHFVDSHSMSEVGQRCGKSEQAIKGSVFRARRTLRAEFPSASSC